jgi:AraC-like DNA-binding protein
VNRLGHLRVRQRTLQPGEEWLTNDGLWHFVRLSGGIAYWLGLPGNRSINPGELLVLSPFVTGTLRASQIGEAVLHEFSFSPDLLFGFLTLDERRFFEDGHGADQRHVRFLPPTHAASQRLAAMIHRGGKCYSLAERAEVIGILAAVFDPGISETSLKSWAGASAQTRFEELMSTLPDIEMLNHAPGELAAFCGCSLRHFNRLFKKRFGVSARARQSQLRALTVKQVGPGDGAELGL